MNEASVFSYTDDNEAQIFKNFATSRKGLSSSEALNRLAKFGPNKLESNRLSWGIILLNQFRSSFIYLLIGAALLAYVLHEPIDALMIVIFIVINTALGFFQEFRSEKAAQMLKKFTVAKTTVRRDGKEKIIPTDQIVIGDYLILCAGDIVPADMRIFDQEDLTVDESVLTGESNPVVKTAAALNKSATDLFHSQNLCFSGTSIITGKASGIVIAIGAQTSIGKIAHLTSRAEEASAFERGIQSISNFILRLVTVTIVLVFIANLLIKGGKADPIEMIIFSIALAVSVIPEALPLVTTFSLSHGALRMAKKHVIVRRLSSIEDLGGIEILCSDKTGTLTENKLSVAQIYGDKDAVLLTATKAIDPENLDQASISSFDNAMINYLHSGKKTQLPNTTIIKDIPFDPDRRRGSALVKEGGQNRLIVRGAPEEIIRLCSDFSPENQNKAFAWISEEGQAGHRVLAIAERSFTRSSYQPEDEKDLQFTGLISFADPLKPTAKDAISKAEALGVQIKILTGDSKEVAGQMSKEIGLIPDTAEVITGSDLAKLNPDTRTQAINKYHVFARITPEQKFDIIKTLSLKNSVGFLGEGINDAPALKAASVGIVVDDASDIAREAADIILLEKSLDAIIDGIKEGREVFANTVKYIKITLASNFGNFYSVAVASLFINFLPMLPIQILLLNLLSDFPMIAISTDTVDEEELRSPKKYNVREIAYFASIFGAISSFFDFVYFMLFLPHGQSTLQTNWFIGSILTEIILIFSIRTRLPFFKAKIAAAPLIFLSFLGAFFTILIPLLAFGHSFFRFKSPAPNQVVIIIAIVLTYFLITEIVKYFYFKKKINLRFERPLYTSSAK